MATNKTGNAQSKGGHERPTRDRPAKVRMTSYHSGIMGSDSARFGAGS